MEKEAMFEPVFFLSLINVKKPVVCPHLLEKVFEEINYYGHEIKFLKTHFIIIIDLSFILQGKPTQDHRKYKERKHILIVLEK